MYKNIYHKNEYISAIDILLKTLKKHMRGNISTKLLFIFLSLFQQKCHPTVINNSTFSYASSYLTLRKGILLINSLFHTIRTEKMTRNAQTHVLLKMQRTGTQRSHQAQPLRVMILIADSRPSLASARGTSRLLVMLRYHKSPCETVSRGIGLVTVL